MGVIRDEVKRKIRTHFLPGYPDRVIYPENSSPAGRGRVQGKGKINAGKYHGYFDFQY